MNIFVCPECGKPISGFRPSRCACGYSIPMINGVYQFTDDAPISVDHGLKWLGYENVGTNYEPAFWQNDGDFGMFGACSRKLVEIIGKGKIIPDLGAGLGPASVPLAMAGAQVIAVDISQKMLDGAELRAKRNGVDQNQLVCARMNAYQLKLADQSVDAVVEIDMLHQVDHPELVVKEIKRVLKPDGVFVRYGCKGLAKTKEQDEANAKCCGAQKELQDYYHSLITEAGYGEPVFSSWEQAAACVTDTFGAPKIVDTDEIQEWKGNLGFCLFKTKTRASGSSQLIPEEIHSEAWRKTNEYAVKKFGANYAEMKRFSRFIGTLEIYGGKIM